MAYSCDIAKLLAAQLQKFATLNRHQLAGQAANLGFWLDETAHCLAVIDGYSKRFESLKNAQEKYVDLHRTREFLLDDACCTGGRAAAPRRINDGEIRDARRELCNATYRFLVRCRKEGLINERMLRESCANLGISVDPADVAV